MMAAWDRGSAQVFLRVTTVPQVCPHCSNAMVRQTEGDTQHIFCPSIFLSNRDVRVKVAFFKESVDRHGDSCGFQWYSTEKNYIG